MVKTYLMSVRSGARMAVDSSRWSSIQRVLAMRGFAPNAVLFSVPVRGVYGRLRGGIESGYPAIGHGRNRCAGRCTVFPSVEEGGLRFWIAWPNMAWSPKVGASPVERIYLALDEVRT